MKIHLYQLLFVNFSHMLVLYAYYGIRKPLKYVKNLKAEETTHFCTRKLYLLEVRLCALSSRFFFLQVHSAVYAFIVDNVKEGAAELF